MKKVFLILFLFLIPFDVFSLELPNLYSKKMVLYDYTEHKVLLEKGSQDVTSIASLTKIMTTMVALEKIENLDDKVYIEKRMLNGIPSEASVAGLKVGETVTYRDLLYASILPSGADATQVLAYSLYGGISSFVEKMNQKAKEIGMKNTHFVNVTGLDAKNHYSTLSDLTLLLEYALKNEDFEKIYTTKEYILTNGLKVKSTIFKYNESMKLDTTRILGSKTGYTKDAGLCMSMIFESNGHEIIFISIGADYIYGNFYNMRDAVKIIDFVDQNFGNQILFEKGETVYKIPIELSGLEEYSVLNSENITKYLPKDFKKKEVKVEYRGKNLLTFQDKKGDKIGQISYLYKNEKFKEEDIILTQDIPIDFFKVLAKYWYIVIGIIAVIVISLILTIILKNKK